MNNVESSATQAGEGTSVLAQAKGKEPPVQTFPVGPADHIYVPFLSLNISDRWSLMSLTMPWLLLQLGNTMGAHLVKMLACGQQMHASIMFLSWRISFASHLV